MVKPVLYFHKHFIGWFLYIISQIDGAFRTVQEELSHITALKEMQSWRTRCRCDRQRRRRKWDWICVSGLRSCVWPKSSRHTDFTQARCGSAASFITSWSTTLNPQQQQPCNQSHVLPPTWLSDSVIPVTKRWCNPPLIGWRERFTNTTPLNFHLPRCTCIQRGS